MKKVIIIVLLFSYFKTKGMITNFNDSLRQLDLKKHNYRIASIADQIKEPNSAWWQLLNNYENCEAFVTFLAKKCFTQSNPLIAAIHVAYYLNHSSVQKWIKNYLRTHKEEKEKIERDTFHQFLVVDSIPFIKYLYTLGINFSHNDTQGRTWLMSAIMAESTQIACFFVEYAEKFGINLMAQDIYGQTALNYAYKLKNTKLVQLLSSVYSSSTEEIQKNLNGVVNHLSE